MTAFGPATEQDLADFLAASAHVRVSGSNSQADFRLPLSETCAELEMSGYAGIVDYSPADQVVTVRSGSSVADIQEELAKHSQALPIPGYGGTIGGYLSMDPAAPAATCRDWLLGAKVMLADGMVAKAGSKVVKSVAGYDVHKLFVGARGSLGIILEATFKTSPANLVQNVTPEQPRKLEITDPTQIQYMRRAKALFDPTNKLNPGEMGVC